MVGGALFKKKRHTVEGNFIDTFYWSLIPWDGRDLKWIIGVAGLIESLPFFFHFPFGN